MTGTQLAPADGARLKRLATEIRWHEQQAQGSARSAIQHKAEIGTRLVKAKDILPHGRFIAWVKEQFGWSDQHARRHMALAANPTRVLDLPADVPWREIEVALRSPVSKEQPARPAAPSESPGLDLPRNDYRLVLADPPWQYQSWNGNGTGRVADDHYPTMELEAVKALPVARSCAPDAVLLCWATMPLLREALEVLAAWGFDYRTAFLIWGKLNADRSPAVGFGRYTRSNGEVCLLGRRGAGVAPLPGVAISNLLLSARGPHSQKPLRQYEVIDEVFGRDVPRVELFARKRMPGWDVWGLEAPDIGSPVSAQLTLEVRA